MLAQQTPDALNYGAQPLPGCPFKCCLADLQSRTPPRVPLYVPDAQNNGERPQAKEPSKFLNGWSYRERLAKEAF